MDGVREDLQIVCVTEEDAKRQGKMESDDSLWRLQEKIGKTERGRIGKKVFECSTLIPPTSAYHSAPLQPEPIGAYRLCCPLTFKIVYYMQQRSKF